MKVSQQKVAWFWRYSVLNPCTLNIQESLKHAWHWGIGFLRYLAAKVIYGLDHMIKMTAMPMYDKIVFYRIRATMILKLGMQYLGHKLYKVYIDDDPGLT